MDITYEIVTPESAADGDVADRGYEERDMEFDSLFDMIEYMLNKGAMENSGSGWWNSEPTENHKTLGFHPQDLTVEEENVVEKSIRSGRNQARSVD